jgi:hypothetical protein
VTRRRITLLVVTPVVLVACLTIYLVVARLLRDPIAPLYSQNCAVCHGENLEGAAQGTPLVGRALVHGDSADEIARSIAEGFAATGMPGWSNTLDENQIRGLAILISEKRAMLGRTEFKTDIPLVIPEGVIASERHAFRIESVASGLHPLPYSIAPLPDGRILLTEKVRGLSIISPDGKQSPLIEGTPPVHDDGFELLSLVYGRGWMLDVALHPEYEKNGWIYLHFGDRCRECDTSMNKLVRGRIADGRWASEEVIWSAAPESYTETSDMTAGGRISFDGNGHVFLSVGIKGPSDHAGVQDLSLPYGKIHRVQDDGRIPADNPFVNTAGALPSIWSYGHRSPQGLEFDARTGRLWSTEMGPRGGDGFNLLRPGKNYGWPFTSKGVNYDGTPVAWGKELSITFDLASSRSST